MKTTSKDCNRIAKLILKRVKAAEPKKVFLNQEEIVKIASAVIDELLLHVPKNSFKSGFIGEEPNPTFILLEKIKDELNYKI